MPASRPNVLLFISHDTGRFVSPCGYDTVHTPAFEQLAAEGVNCTNTFTTCPLCSPARSAITTGRYPHQNGVMGLTGDGTGGFDLYPTERHAARLFGEAGYEATLCGFEHEARDCRSVGFETVMCGRGGVNGGGDLREYPAGLDAWLRDRDPNRPFYLQIGCHETHRDWAMHDTPPDDSKGVWRPPYLLDLPEIREDMAKMQGASRRLDEGVGSILNLLDHHGVGDDTIVIVTTDHGIDLPRAKGTFYDPGIEVFLFCRWRNGGWRRGVLEDTLLSQIGLLPTLLTACNIPSPDNLAGQSFEPLLRSEACPTPPAVFAEKTYHDTYDPTRTLRTERFKYIRYFEANIFQDLRLATMTNRHWWSLDWRRRTVEELYDLAADPLEANNLSADPDQAETLAELRGQLRDWMRGTNDPLLDGPVASPFYAAQLEAFRAD